MATSARLDELKKKFDENPRRYFAPLANEHRKQGDLTEAIALCRTHLSNQPGHISGHIVLAQALHEAGELAEARQTFEQSLEFDPENLIALRSLGDIAKEQGDVATARIWYQRVLDSDPRNDEITHILRDLRAAPTESFAYSLPDPADAKGSNPSDFAPPADARPRTPVSVAVIDTTSTTEPKSASNVEDLMVSNPFEPSADPQPRPADYNPFTDAFKSDAPAPGQPNEIAPESSADSFEPDALAFTSRSSDALGEFEAMAEPSVDDWFGNAGEPSEEASPAADAASDAGQGQGLTVSVPTPSSGVEAQPTLVSLESFDLLDEGREEPKAAVEEALADAHVPPVTPNPSEESSAPEYTIPSSWGAQAADQHLDVPALHQPAMESPAEPVAEEASVELDWISGTFSSNDGESDVAPLEGLVSAEFEPPSPSAEAAKQSTIEPPPNAPEAQQTFAEEPSDPVYGRTPSATPLDSPATPAAFVTETMAELYLQQGFTDEALGVYEELLARNPHDESLQARVRALQHGEPSSLQEATAAAEGARQTMDKEGHSVRAFFGRLARRQPTARPAARQSALDVASLGAQVAQRQAENDSPLAANPDSPLAQMFSAVRPSGADVTAAEQLASAFGTQGATGRPTRPADSELSLDHLFRDVPAGPSGAVTLDEFFSAESGGSTTPERSEDSSPGAGEKGADIEQFTAWLDGLKKK
jgi:tetratricopeptide (TPR) repeat protein